MFNNDFTGCEIIYDCMALIPMHCPLKMPNNLYQEFIYFTNSILVWKLEWHLHKHIVHKYMYVRMYVCMYTYMGDLQLEQNY